MTQSHVSAGVPRHRPRLPRRLARCCTASRELVTNDPAAGPGLLGIVPGRGGGDAGRADRLGRTGRGRHRPADVAVDLGGRAVLPGWVDSHSHVVFAGDRAAEFSARMAGQPYAAGGMQATVAATREADGSGAAGDRPPAPVAEMIAGGTTCMETKTGYGLTTHDEVRSATTAQAAGFDEITFLGAHVVPPEFAKDPDGYLDLVCGPMLDAVAPQVGLDRRVLRGRRLRRGADPAGAGRRYPQGTGPAGARQSAGGRARGADRGGHRRRVGRPLHVPHRTRHRRVGRIEHGGHPAAGLRSVDPAAAGARPGAGRRRAPGSRWRPTAIPGRRTRRR